MSEQKTEKEGNEEEIKPTKENVSDEYLKGYRVGYNRAVKRFKRNKLEIQVKKDEPKQEIKRVEEKSDSKKDKADNGGSNRVLMGVIIAVVLGFMVLFYVFRTRNNERE